MKKSILIAVLGLAATTVAYGGVGQILFGNYYNSLQTTGVTYGNGPDAGLGVGPEISATLLWGASTDTLLSQLTPVVGSTTPFGLGVATGPAPIGGGTGAGWFFYSTPTTIQLTINGGVPGNYAFAIEATGTLNGVTYTGFSPIAVGPTQPNPTYPIPNLPNALRQGSFAVYTPEPSILALTGMSAAALLIRRRAASNPAVAGEDGKK
jgi:hypothetical protein